MTTRRARRQRQAPPQRTDLVTALKQFATSWGGVISFSVTLIVLVLVAGIFRIPPFSNVKEPTPDPWGVVSIPKTGGVVKVAYIGDTSKGSDSGGAAAALRHVLKDRSSLKDKDVRVELVTADDTCNAEAATAKARELAEDPQLVAVISSACHTSAMAAQAVFEETHHSYLVLGNHDPTLTGTGTLAMGTQTTFRVSWNQAAQGKEAAVGAYTDLSLRRALLAHDGSTDAEAVAKEFATSFRAQRKDRQGEVPDVVALSSPTDVEALAKRIPSVEPDLVFYAGNGRLAAALQQALSAQKYTGQYLVNDTARGNSAFTSVGAGREGTYAIEMALPKGTGYDTWKEAFEKDNGAPGPLAAEANDALLVVMQALDSGTQSKADKFEIGRRIFSQIVRSFPVDGVTGRLGFDAKGDRNASAVSLVKFTDGAYVAVPKVTPTPAGSLTPSADTQAAMATALATMQAGLALGTPVAEGTPAAAATPGATTPGAVATPAAGAPGGAPAVPSPAVAAPTPGS